MENYQDRIREALDGMVAQPKDLIEFLRKMSADARGVLESFGLKIPEEKVIDFAETPEDAVKKVSRWGDGGDLDARRKWVRSFVEGIDLISPSSEEKSGMPPGAVRLGEKQLRRIVG